MLALDLVHLGENCIPPDVGERDKLSHILFYVISVSDVGGSSKPQINHHTTYQQRAPSRHPGGIESSDAFLFMVPKLFNEAGIGNHTAWDESGTVVNRRG